MSGGWHRCMWEESWCAGEEEEDGAKDDDAAQQVMIHAIVTSSCFLL